MTLSEFLLHAFVLVDDEYHEPVHTRLRSRGLKTTKLTDSKVLTIEIVGEYLGLDHDVGIFAHFARYHQAEFPTLAGIHRTSFVRQAANLYAIPRQIHKHLADKISAREVIWLINSLPINVCNFARAKFCQGFKEDAAYGSTIPNAILCADFGCTPGPRGAVRSSPSTDWSLVKPAHGMS
jgi:hypothetical protein